MATNVYEIVTKRIISEMEKGIIPWHRPWCGVAEGARSYTTGKPYSLINQFLICEEGEFITFKQAQKLGGSVKKGAKYRLVVFYQPLVKEAETAEGEKKIISIPCLRYYNVFNIKDCEGIEPHNDIKPYEHTGSEAAERVISDYIANNEPLKFQNDKPSNRAYYSPSEDKVVVPMLSQYAEESEYYSTAFHELTHSTMPKSRCNRVSEGKIAAFGDEVYSREELVAEIGANFLCNTLGINTKQSDRNSVAYLQNWIAALKSDSKMIIWAASRAEKAANYILGITAESEDSEK